MGVYDSLKELKAKKTLLENAITNADRYYRQQRIAVETLEGELRLMKKNRNWAYKQWKNQREQLQRIDRKIKSLPSQARKYGKENPLKMFDEKKR